MENNIEEGIKTRISLWLNIATTGYAPKGNEVRMSKRNVYSHVHCITADNVPKQMKKERSVPPKKDEILLLATGDEPAEPDTEGLPVPVHSHVEAKESSHGSRGLGCGGRGWEDVGQWK